MQDITIKRRSHAITSPVNLLHTPKTKQPGSRVLVVNTIESILTLADQVGSHLVRFFGDERQLTVVHKPHKGLQLVKAEKTTPASRPANVQKVRSHRGHQLKAKVVEKTKKTAHTVKSAIKTPLGKVSTVQAIALIALFAYAASNAHQPTGVFESKSAGAAVEAGLRSYLPSSGEYSPPTAFSLSQTSNQKVAFHLWLTPWNLPQLNQADTNYQSVSVFWLTTQADGIHVQPKADWSKWQAAKSQSKNQAKTYYLTVTGDPDFTSLTLNDQSVQNQHITELLQVVTAQQFDGIDIDYEGLGIQNQDAFTAFIQNLANQFHAQHKKVAVTVEARIANQVPMNWKQLGQSADEVRIMAYDYHAASTNFPGPIAPLSWVKEILDYAQSKIPADKLIIGLGNYGYDWTKPANDQDSWQGVGVSFDQAMAQAQQYSAPIIRATGIDDRGYDIGSIPTFTYKDSDGNQHAVWFEDSTSLQAKVNLVSQYQTAGIIFWSVGLGDQTFWQANSSK